MSELVWEGDVAEQLGLDRKALAKVRAGLDLIEEVDWCNGPHRRLMLTESGFEKISGAVAADRESGAEGQLGAAEGAPMPVLPKLRAPKKFTARVVSVPRCLKLLDCRRVGAEGASEGPILRVRVQSNLNFTDGLVVPIREAVGQPGAYYYDGVLPKRKGVLPASKNR